MDPGPPPTNNDSEEEHVPLLVPLHIEINFEFDAFQDENNNEFAAINFNMPGAHVGLLMEAPHLAHGAPPHHENPDDHGEINVEVFEQHPGDNHMVNGLVNHVGNHPHINHITNHACSHHDHDQDPENAANVVEISNPLYNGEVNHEEEGSAQNELQVQVIDQRNIYIVANGPSSHRVPHPSLSEDQEDKESDFWFDDDDDSSEGGFVLTVRYESLQQAESDGEDESSEDEHAVKNENAEDRIVPENPELGDEGFNGAAEVEVAEAGIVQENEDLEGEILNGAVDNESDEDEIFQEFNDEQDDEDNEVEMRPLPNGHAIFIRENDDDDLDDLERRFPVRGELRNGLDIFTPRLMALLILVVLLPIALYFWVSARFYLYLFVLTLLLFDF